MAALPPTPRTRLLPAALCHVPLRRHRVCVGLCSAAPADDGCAEPPDVVLECKRLDRLVKSGRLADALDLFDRMPRKNVVAWTSVMSGCTRNGRPEEALAMFADMVESGVAPNDFACNAALVACADLGALRAGEQVHSLAVRAGFAGDAWIGGCLIEMYSRCGSLPAAKDVFDRMESPDVVGYTSLISAYCRNGEFEPMAEALGQMMRQGLKPNEHTTTTILAACPRVLGEQIHGYLIKTMGLQSQSVYSSTALIDFYSRNGEFGLAKSVFESLHCKNVVSWCSMMQLHIRDGKLEEALQVFVDMISEGVDPNEFALSIALGACGFIGLGRQLHCSAIKHNLITDIRVANALLSMYGRTGLVQELETVLNKIENPDHVSWTTAISANFQNGFGDKAIALLCQMHSEGFTPNDYAFSSVLSSCADLASLDQGMQLHCLALKLGCDSKICTGNALINMYSKCGQIGSARLAFDVMQIHDVTSWNSLIHGYAQHGDANQALEAFSKMCSNGDRPDESTFLGVLMGYNHSGMVKQGELFFRLMIDRYSFAPTPSHYACMIDMLGRNGRFHEALLMINGMPFEPDALTWKTLLASCKLHRNLDMGKLAADKLMELSGTDSASYVLMSSIHAMHGEWEDAGKVRRRMDETGVKKDAGCSWIEIKNEVHSFAARDMSHPDSASIYQMLGELVSVMLMQNSAHENFDELESFDVHMPI
ncbi:pentatricopeptide repeat-containing protein At2g27610-like [Oryza brachyantha]|uniref:Pentatricopeptide repeat-containing protein n=1 Tax=Oryza brachyantha TaxID=4533 RepID=J3LUP8_ORYBR|nr:pentatricopeptide repeat-containing protein At2g27610-like [Oryza brachyantha]